MSTQSPVSGVRSQAMIVTTTENVAGARVTSNLGQVFGLTVRSRSLGGNIVAWLEEHRRRRDSFLREAQRGREAPSG